MKKLLFFLCMIPNLVFAQEVLNETRTVSCVNEQNLNKLVTEFDEVPFIRALNVPVLGIAQLNSLVIFVNSKTSLSESSHEKKAIFIPIALHALDICIIELSELWIHAFSRRFCPFLFFSRNPSPSWDQKHPASSSHESLCLYGCPSI